MDWNSHAVRQIVKSALLEDRANSDITTKTLIDPRWTLEAQIRAKQSGVVAGLPLAARFFAALDPKGSFHMKVRDGAHVLYGDVLATVGGKAQAILAAERPALNALQHLSGIAT